MYALKNLFKDQRKNIKNFDKKLALEEKRLEIALQISTARQDEGITQKKLAKKLKTTQLVIYRIENGKQNISWDWLFRIANIYNKDIHVQRI